MWKEKYKSSTPSRSLVDVPTSSAVESEDEFDKPWVDDTIDPDHDAFEAHISSSTVPSITDPIAHYSRQLAAGIDPEFSQMALDYLSAPGEYFFGI